MRTQSAARHFHTTPRTLVLGGVVLLALAAIALPFYSASSKSLAVHSSSARNSALNRVGLGKSAAMALHAATSNPEPLVDAVTTFAADCTTPKTDFALGDVVCIKATGVPVTVFTWHVNWVDTVGFVRQTDPAIANDTTTYTYQLPATATTVVNDQTVINTGTWRINLARFSGLTQNTVQFTVHDTNNPSADVFVQKFAREINNFVPSGNNVAFIIVVANNGPDTASNVHLVDSPAAGFSPVSFSQQSGPTCNPAGNGDCTIASLARGERAEFTAIYTTGAQGTFTTSATVSNDVTDPDTTNNTASADIVVTSPSGNGTCDLTCPTSITVNADTTEGGQRGAHVNYDAVVGTGTCGTITSTPASGSFFPVGTTVVTATSENGGGSCQFTVDVEESNGNVTISCPADVSADADANCAANVTINNPTVTGSNVTFHGVRSDGQALYNCDCYSSVGDTCEVTGSCTRVATDAPFASGVTTITWIAYSHDTPGPYATPADEEAHRTGSTSCTQRITVTDVTPPTISAPNTSASADANCQAPVPDYSTLATVHDNCACASSDTSQICDTRQDIVVTQSPAPGTLVGLGAHDITLTANDGSSNNGGAGNTTTIHVTFTVNDTTPPTFTFVPPAVVAYTGPGATTCDTFVSDATLGTATATDNCGPVTVTRSPTGNTFPVGTTTVVWTATDGAGNSTTANQTVTVIDNTVPVITTNGQTPSMWPPNHAYQTFAVTDFVSSVFDNCGGISVSDVVISNVTSDEAVNGNGSGNTLNDIVIASNCRSVQLRAEREGGGDGRVYTITFKVTDTHGNVGTATANVVVPHNPGETPVNSGVQYTVNGTCP